MFGPGRRMARRTSRRTARRVSRRQGAMYDDGGYDDEPQQQAAPAAAEPTESEQLEELAKLHAQGILTDEEFAAKKAQILGL